MSTISGFYTPANFQNSTALGQNARLRDSIAQLNARIGVLQEQQTTGKRAFTHGDLGSQAQLVQGLRQKVSGLDGYLRTIGQVSTRIEGSQQAMDVLQSVGDRLGINGMAALNTDADIQLQQIPREARGALESMLSALNSTIDGRYVFAGDETQTRPVAEKDVILNGEPGKMGLKDFAALRLQADQGDDGMGRLSISRGEAPFAGDTLSLKSTGGVFGLKLKSMEVSGEVAMPGIYETVGGAPFDPTTDARSDGRRADLTFTDVGDPDDQVDITFELPDGTETTVVMKAVSTRTGTPPVDVVEYEIGDTAAETATSFRVALEGKIREIVRGELAGASSKAAADSFFDDNPPRAPEGADPTAATALASVGRTTVAWYNGPHRPNVQVDGHVEAVHAGLPQLDDAPGAPKAGDQYLVGPAPTPGDPFDTHAGEIATWDGTAWNFTALGGGDAGLRVVADDNWTTPADRGQVMEWNGAAWVQYQPADGTQVIAGAQAGGDRSQAVMVYDAGSTTWSVADPQPETVIDDSQTPPRIGTYDGFTWQWTTPEVGQTVDDLSLDPDRVIQWDGTTWANTLRSPESIPDARDTVTAKVDDNTYVSYGARAIEQGFRESVKNAAILAAVDHDKDNPEHYHALTSRSAPALKVAAQDIIDVRTAIGVTENRIETLKMRHEDVASLTEQQVERLEGVDEYEVATELLNMMEQLRATYSITGKLANLTLSNFI